MCVFVIEFDCALSTTCDFESYFFFSIVDYFNLCAEFEWIELNECEKVLFSFDFMVWKIKFRPYGVSRMTSYNLFLPFLFHFSSCLVFSLNRLIPILIQKNGNGLIQTMTQMNNECSEWPDIKSSENHCPVWKVVASRIDRILILFGGSNLETFGLWVHSFTFSYVFSGFWSF